jgi:AMP-binding enzyme
MKHGYPDGCIHELFERQAASTPNRVALIAGTQSLTFSELNARANRVVTARGVRPEVFVGVCLERSLDAIVALIGILKAGGAYVYLDPSFPAHWLPAMVLDSGLEFVITRESLGDSIFGGAEGIELLYADSAEIERVYTHDPLHRVGRRVACRRSNAGGGLWKIRRGNTGSICFRRNAGQIGARDPANRINDHASCRIFREVMKSAALGGLSPR